jgi:KDO2-lipid IV(A) lauroyltransferase
VIDRRSLRARAIIRDAIGPAVELIQRVVIVGFIRLIQLFPVDATGRAFSAIARKFGPYLREHRIGRANLALAFPEKSPEEIELILAGVWDNLGRVVAEFAHIGELWRFDLDHPERGRVEFGPHNIPVYEALKSGGKGALIFSAHLGNWELPALAGPAHDVPSAVLFRQPNVAAFDHAVQQGRAVNMGTLVATTPDAPVKLARMLQDGIHVGMLIDQFFDRGVYVDFFGQKTRVNPLLAKLAQHVDCPIHGVRCVRLPGNRFRIDVTPEIEPVRDARGKVDVQATMQAVTSVIEGWVREHPEQWLWLHRRWRDY